MDQRTAWNGAVGSGKRTALHADLLDYLRTLVCPTECELRLGRVGAIIPAASDFTQLDPDEWPMCAADGTAALAAVRTLTGPPARDNRCLADRSRDNGLNYGTDTALPIRFLMPGDHRAGSTHPGARPVWLADGYRLTAAIAEAADQRGRRMRIIFPRATYRLSLEGARFEHRLDLQAGDDVPLVIARAAEDTTAR